MNRKSAGPSIQWSTIVISWVNLFEKEPLSKISNIKRSSFISESITTIFKFSGMEDVSFKNSDDLALKFIKEYYPEIIKERRFNTKNEDDILILLSMIMYTTCVRCKIEDFVTKTCSIKLEDSHQEAMKKFFELMLTIEDGNFTRRNIVDTIQQCFEPLVGTGARKSLSPSAQRNGLKELLGSPVLQEKYKKSKEENDVKHLNALLQEENSELTQEKEMLTKKNQDFEVFIKKLQTQLNEKTEEIASLREELWQYANKGTADDALNHTEKTFKKEIHNLKKDLIEMQVENDGLLKENGKYVQQISDMQVALKEREDDLIEKLKVINVLDQKLEAFQERNVSLENDIKEMKQIIEQYQEERRCPKEELNMSAPRVEENIGQVLIDIELKEKQETINQLQHQLKSLELLCEEKDGEIKQLENNKKDIERKLESKCYEFDELARNSSWLQQNNSELLAQQETLQGELSLSLTKTQELEKQLYESNNELNLEIAEKNSQLTELHAIIHSLENEKKEIETQINDQSSMIKALELSKKDLESKLQSVRCEFEDLTHASSGLQQQVDKLFARNETLKEELSQALTKTQELENQLYESNHQLNSEIAEKNSQLSELQAVIHTLEIEIEEIKTLIEDQTGKIQHLEINKMDLESKLQLKSSEFEDLTHASSGLQQQVDDLSAKNETLQEELSLALTKTQELEKQLLESNFKLNSETAEKDSQLAKLQAVIDTLEMENNKIQTLLEDQAGKIKQLEISKTDLENKLQLKSCEFEDLAIAYSSLQQQVDDLSAKNEEISQDLTKMQELEKQLYESNQQMNCVTAEKNSQLTELEAVVRTLEMENKQIQTQLEDQNSKIKQLEVTRIDLESKLQSKSSEFEDLICISSGLHQQIDDLSDKNKSYREELSLALTKTQELEKQLLESSHQLNCETAEKDSQLTELNAAIRTLEVENKEMKTLIEEQIGKIQHLEKGKIDLESKLQSKCCEFEDLTRSSTDLERQVGDLTAKNQTLQEELAQASIQTHEFENKMHESNRQLNCEIAEKDSQITQLNAVIHTLEMEKRESQTQIEDQVSSLKAKIIDLETNIDAKKAECMALNKEIVHFNGVLLSLQSEYNVMDVKNKELTSQLSSVTAGAAHLENVIQEDNFKIDLQERTIRKLESATHERDEIIDKLKEEVLSLKTAIDESKKLGNEKETDVENLKDQLNIKSGVINRLREEVEKLISDKERLNDMFIQVEVEKNANQKIRHELHSENLSLKTDLKEHIDKITSLEQELLAGKEQVAQFNTELATEKDRLQKASETCEQVIEENRLLKKKLENHDPQLKEAYDKLFDDYHRLNGEHDELKTHLEKLRASVRAEYDEILKKMKSHMKLTCTRALEAKDEKHAKELKDLQEVVKANQDHISQLSTNLWDTSDKLLITRNENEELKKTVIELKRMLSLHQSAPDGLQRTRSHDQLGLHNQKGLRMVEEETVTVSRRQSLRTVPSGIGKVFPSEDEAEEMFNNDCLADLKAGRCQVAAAGPDRMSTLMYRNSLCPPHLKSSYPAETQFLPIDALHEDDIKGRGLGDDAKLLPDKRRKDRSQPMELKNVTSPRSALRELNDENRKPGTPSRLFSHLFPARQRRNENIQATPDRRRLSFFGKHFVKKEPTE